MGLVVGLRDTLGCEVGVNLRSGGGGVAKQLLHHAQIRAMGEQMGSEGMAKFVWGEVGGQPRNGEPTLHETFDGARGERLTFIVEEDRTLGGIRARPKQVGLVAHGGDGLASGTPQEANPLLVALADDAARTLDQTDGGVGEGSDFGETGTGGIERLEEGAIT